MKTVPDEWPCVTTYHGQTAVAYSEGRQEVMDRVMRGLEHVREEAERCRERAHNSVLSGRGYEDKSPLWWGGRYAGLLEAARIIDEKFR